MVASARRPRPTSSLWLTALTAAKSGTPAEIDLRLRNWRAFYTLVHQPNDVNHYGTESYGEKNSPCEISHKCNHSKVLGSHSHFGSLGRTGSPKLSRLRRQQSQGSAVRSGVYGTRFV